MVVVSSFFIKRDGCGLKFIGLILGRVVVFLIIAVIVPCDPRKAYAGDGSSKWAGVVLGLINVAFFMGMYAAALCCLDGCCK